MRETIGGKPGARSLGSVLPKMVSREVVYGLMINLLLMMLERSRRRLHRHLRAQRRREWAQRRALRHSAKAMA